MSAEHFGKHSVLWTFRVWISSPPVEPTEHVAVDLAAVIRVGGWARRRVAINQCVQAHGVASCTVAALLRRGRAITTGCSSPVTSLVVGRVVVVLGRRSLHGRCGRSSTWVCFSVRAWRWQTRSVIFFVRSPAAIGVVGGRRVVRRPGRVSLVALWRPLVRWVALSAWRSMRRHWWSSAPISLLKGLAESAVKRRARGDTPGDG